MFAFHEHSAFYHIVCWKTKLQTKDCLHHQLVSFEDITVHKQYIIILRKKDSETEENDLFICELVIHFTNT